MLRSTIRLSTTHKSLCVVVKNLLHGGFRDIVGVGALIEQARGFAFHHRVALGVVEANPQAMLAGDFETQRQAL